MPERHYQVGDMHRSGDPEGNITVLFDRDAPYPSLRYFTKHEDGTWCWADRANETISGGTDFEPRQWFSRDLVVHAIAPEFKAGDRVSGLGVYDRQELVGYLAFHADRNESCIVVGGKLRIVKTDSLVARPNVRTFRTLEMTNAQDPAPEAAPTVRAQVLREAERITATDRNSSYGEPEDNFARIAAFWNVFLQDKLKPGVEITAGDTAALMIMVKLAREMNAPTEDNKIDIAGYAACWAEVDAKKEEEK